MTLLRIISGGIAGLCALVVVAHQIAHPDQTQVRALIEIWPAAVGLLVGVVGLLIAESRTS